MENRVPGARAAHARNTRRGSRGHAVHGAGLGRTDPSDSPEGNELRPRAASSAPGRPAAQKGRQCRNCASSRLVRTAPTPFSRRRGSGGRFSLPIDDRLRIVARGQFSRLAQYEIEVESPLRPKEIQDRIRAGETAEEIADAAGVPIERVRRFEGPVLAERAYRAQEAQRATAAPARGLRPRPHPRGPGDRAACARPGSTPPTPNGTHASGRTAAGRSGSRSTRAAARTWPSGSTTRTASTSRPPTTPPRACACPRPTCPAGAPGPRPRRAQRSRPSPAGSAPGARALTRAVRRSGPACPRRPAPARPRTRRESTAGRARTARAPGPEGSGRPVAALLGPLLGRDHVRNTRAQLSKPRRGGPSCSPPSAISPMPRGASPGGRAPWNPRSPGDRWLSAAGPTGSAFGCRL